MAIKLSLRDQLAKAQKRGDDLCLVVGELQLELRKIKEMYKKDVEDVFNKAYSKGYQQAIDDQGGK